ncbi:MAG TPA: orange carotenoid protein N-terminal domain-containing protein [Kamptonema sp.]|nr:orange carotenoid protein N-terminal domain-containing protein [Kamptonema sp.]
MTSTTNVNSTHARSGNTQEIVQAIGALGTDEQLALLYFIYEKMGGSITPAAPVAAEPELASVLLEKFYSLLPEQQLNVMRDIVKGEDTEYSRAYGALTANNKLLVWYAWAVDMGDKVVDLPEGYQATQVVNNALTKIEALEFEQQISVLRDVADTMGYSDVQPIATQAEVGKTASL